MLHGEKRLGLRLAALGLLVGGLTTVAPGIAAATTDGQAEASMSPLGNNWEGHHAVVPLGNNWEGHHAVVPLGNNWEGSHAVSPLGNNWE